VREVTPGPITPRRHPPILPVTILDDTPIHMGHIHRRHAGDGVWNRRADIFSMTHKRPDTPRHWHHPRRRSIPTVDSCTATSSKSTLRPLPSSPPPSAIGRAAVHTRRVCRAVRAGVEPGGQPSTHARRVSFRTGAASVRLCVHLSPDSRAQCSPHALHVAYGSCGITLSPLLTLLCPLVRQTSSFSRGNRILNVDLSHLTLPI
jgi:hypothetical protein